MPTRYRTLFAMLAVTAALVVAHAALAQPPAPPPPAPPGGGGSGPAAAAPIGYSCAMDIDGAGERKCFCDATCSKSTVTECKNATACELDPACDATCATAQVPNVECQAVAGSNTGARLTVDPGQAVSFGVRVNGVLGGSGSETIRWTCSPAAGGTVTWMCPAGDFPYDGNGLGTSFADTLASGQSTNFRITVTVTTGWGNAASDYCDITACNNCGAQPGTGGGTGMYQCQSAGAGGTTFGICYASEASCNEARTGGTCPGSCVKCPTNVCGPQVDCRNIEEEGTAGWMDFINSLPNKAPAEYPQQPKQNFPLVPGGVGSGSFNLGVLMPGNFSDFMSLLNAVFTYLLWFAIPIAVIVFLIAGTRIVTSQGEPGKLESGKAILLWGAVGFGIVLLAKGILAAIVEFLT